MTTYMTSPALLLAMLLVHSQGACGAPLSERALSFTPTGASCQATDSIPCYSGLGALFASARLRFDERTATDRLVTPHSVLQRVQNLSPIIRAFTLPRRLLRRCRLCSRCAVEYDSHAKEAVLMQKVPVGDLSTRPYECKAIYDSGIGQCIPATLEAGDPAITISATGEPCVSDYGEGWSTTLCWGGKCKRFIKAVFERSDSLKVNRAMWQQQCLLGHEDLGQARRGVFGTWRLLRQ